jgi:hypothetical protein
MSTSTSMIVAKPDCLFMREFMALLDRPEALEDGLYFTAEFLKKRLGRAEENNPAYIYWLIGRDIEDELGKGEEAARQLQGWENIQLAVHAVFQKESVLDELATSAYVLSVNEAINDDSMITASPEDRATDLVARSFNRVAELYFGLAYRTIEALLDSDPAPAPAGGEG